MISPKWNSIETEITLANSSTWVILKNKMGVYAIVHKETGKIYYGQSSNIYQRIIQHYYGNKSNRFLQEDIRKNGKGAFIIQFLGEANSIESCKMLEEYCKRISDPNLLYNIV